MDNYLEYDWLVVIELPKIRQIIYKVVPPQVSSFVHLRTIGIISKNLTVNLVISQFGKQKNGHSQHFTVLRSSPPGGSCLLLWIQPFQPLVGDVISSFFLNHRIHVWYIC